MSTTAQPNSEIDWRKFQDTEPDDDEPLAETPRSVVRMLGFDPLSVTEEGADSDMPGPDSEGTPEEADKLMEWRSFSKEEAHENHRIYERHEGKIRILVTFKDGKVSTATCNLAAGERGTDRPESTETREGFKGLFQFAQMYGD